MLPKITKKIELLTQLYFDSHDVPICVFFLIFFIRPHNFAITIIIHLALWLQRLSAYKISKHRTTTPGCSSLNSAAKFGNEWV